ncbi:MAG: hypothetical protein A3H33_11395 [Betaproteobacteria bacterium RIFCSPLOWO2_02_FULL_65_20]|nr:MAG: hypothetical protein A3H33_11395 [Betaproteobacteria bacterium RIFCSPLOWO2_02_FULL_65_20]
MRPILLLALLAAVLRAPPAGAAEDLGRMFFTPQQRQDLDRRRAANIQEAAAVVQESTLTVEGQVSRSSGKNTTWINRVPLHDSYRSPDPAQVTITSGEGQSRVKLKVGQTLDNVRGEVRDSLAGGRIEVERTPPAAR